MKDHLQPPPADLEELKLVLQRSPLLRSLMEVAPDLMQTALQDEFIPSGTVLFREGAPGDRAYAIWSGCLRVQHEMGGDAPLILRDCLPGDIVGEMSLLDGRPRSATVVALEDSRLVSLSRDDFGRLLRQKPEIGLALLGPLSHRLRASDEYLIAASRSVDHLTRRIGDLLAGGQNGGAAASSASREGFNLLLAELYEAAEGVSSGLAALRNALPDLLGDRVSELLDLINSHAKRITKHLGHMRDLQRLQSGEIALDRQAVMAGALVEQVAARLAPSARLLQVRLDVHVQPGIPMIRADEELLKQAFTHLVQNALRYSPRGTAIRVELSHLFGRELHISVTDQGPGVPEACRESIFEPFVRGPDENGGGVGLGLAFCKAAIQAHGGRIWVEAGPEGKGSAFMIVLPV